jgi:uncharacterized protein YgbK (DUF1537 family)
MTKPLLAYYGDDLTGSTDVMEALASNGVETVLFMDVRMSRHRLKRFGRLPRLRHCRHQPQRNA